MNYKYTITYNTTAHTVIIESDSGNVGVSEAYKWTDVLQELTTIYGEDLEDDDASVSAC